MLQHHQNDSISNVKCRTLPDLLLQQARAHPDHPAVICGEQTLTMRQLVACSINGAALLRENGVEPGDCVAVYVEPSMQMMLGPWQILFAGGPYIPMSPEYPQSVRYMLKQSRANAVICHDETDKSLRDLAPRGTRIVNISRQLEAQLHPSNGHFQRDSRLSPDDLAYVLYTSGSTGDPKGAMIQHRAIVSQLNWLHDAYGIRTGKRILQKTIPSFDAAQWEILAVACGCTVVMGKPGIHRDRRMVIDFIVKCGITTLQCVPTLLEALVDAEEFRNCTSLTQIFSGGEALTKHLARRCLEALPACTVVNLYGPTECTINASAHTVDPSTLDNGQSIVPIGVPVHDTEFHILDDKRVPVGVGDVGELYIGGVQVGAGYLHQPDLTAERFIDNPFSKDGGKLYKTGDRVHLNPDGTFQYCGRSDHQVKHKGVRMELEGIRAKIESELPWVKHAGVVLKEKGDRKSFLVAFVELNPKEAAIMDQGVPGSAHHQSKASRAQVTAQLSNGGRRDPEELAGKAAFDLPGRAPTPEQWRLAFERKTYRKYEGGAVSKADILELLATQHPLPAPSRSPKSLSLEELGSILRNFGQFPSRERLLPKYTYASPGALNATQLYVELRGVDQLPAGLHYYDPLHHRLALISGGSEVTGAQVKFHFVGKRRAIEPIYKNNIREVLEIETGHMVAVLERVLPRYGLAVTDCEPEPAVLDRLEVWDEDYYLGTFELGLAGTTPPMSDALDIYVQAHPQKIADLPAGQYQYVDGRLELISDELICKRDVIAINQQVYESTSLGITLIARTDKAHMAYINLGRKLQQLQMNDLGMGFMSSGYSSKSGNDLPSARRMDEILRSAGRESGPSYFFLGGRVSREQRESRGMREDIVHSKGPAELLKDAMASILPEPMVPDLVEIVDELPKLPNGKVDLKALRVRELRTPDRPSLPPRTEIEKRLSELWQGVLKCGPVSVLDNFFDLGGDSIGAVSLVTQINEEFKILPQEAVHQAPTIEKLAQRISGNTIESSRLTRLWASARCPIFIWPGLGGGTVNLGQLARRIGGERPMYGIGAYGVNPGEVPFRSIQEMAREDVKLIEAMQPSGPYTLWGYSFGARVAFEAAFQLERAGKGVADLILIAPGSPKIPGSEDVGEDRVASFSSKDFVSVLYSVFAGGLAEPGWSDCLRSTEDRESFAAFIRKRSPDIPADFIDRVIDLVVLTYGFGYTRSDLLDRRIQSPITAYRARGDQQSFIDRSAACGATTPTFIDLASQHYGVLHEPDELVEHMTKHPEGRQPSHASDDEKLNHDAFMWRGIGDSGDRFVGTDGRPAAQFSATTPT